MDLTRFRRAMGRAWYLVVIAAIFGAVGGFFVHEHRAPRYSTSTQLVVGYDGSGPGSTGEQGLRDLAAQRAQSLVQIAPTPPVVAAAMARAGVSGAAPAVTASGGAQDSLFVITVTDSSPQRAAAVANGYPAILLGQLVRLVGPLDGPVRLQTIAPAAVPTTPIGADATTLLLLGLASGLALGLVAALLVELLDGSVHDSDEVASATGLVTLGSVPQSKPRVALPAQTDPRGVRAEAYRQIRTSIGSIEPKLSVIATTSATSGEGKTTVTCNVATTLTRAGYRVLVIDADLRRSRVGAVMDVPTDQLHVGLAQVLQGTATVDEAILVTDGSIPHVLAAGAPPPDPSELLASPRFADVLQTVRRTYDYIFIDTPPVIPVTDALVVAPYTDGMILVARIGYSTPARLRRATAALERVKAPLIGCVPNCAIGGADRDYRYGYGSYTGAEDASPAPITLPADKQAGRRRKH